MIVKRDMQYSEKSQIAHGNLGDTKRVIAIKLVKIRQSN
jgi:hypothetical protein